MQIIEIKNEVEATGVVDVIPEQEDQIIPITEGNYLKNVNGNEFICKICYATFNNFEETLVHTNLIHRSKPYICNVCNVQFVLSAHLYEHQAEHDNYLCMRNSSINPTEIQFSSKSNLTLNSSRNYCNVTVNLQQNVSNKLTQNLSDPDITLQKTIIKPFKCLNCVFATGSEVKFCNHLNICNNISKSCPKFQCNMCIKSFNSQSALNGHFKYHVYRYKLISSNKLGLDKKKMKNQLKNSIVVKSQKKFSPNIPNFNRNHKCEDCNRYFTTFRKLNIHQKRHKPQITCKKCHKKFVFKKSFEKHLVSHTNVITPNSKSVSETKIIKSTVVKHKKQNILPNNK